MELKSRLPVPERILLYGDAGTGKSTAALSIAKYIGDDHGMYVVDTDYSASWHRSLASPRHEGYADRVDVEVVGPEDWPAQLAAVRQAAEQADSGDWIVLDSATPTWQAVQTYYITRKHGEGFFDFFTTNVDREKSDVDMNWQVINAEYAKLYGALFRSRAHLLLTAEADAVGARDDRRIKVLYERYGFKPKGQKTLAYTPHTVLHTSKTRGGEFRISTLKDREREEVEDMVVEDFGREYLMKIAGWRPQKNG